MSAEKLRLFHLEAAAMVRHAGASLLVKAHPNQNPGELKASLGEWGAAGDAFFHTEPLMELLEACDAAIMTFSQAGSEVLMAGVPLAILQEEKMVKQFEAQFPFVSEGGAALFLMGDPENPEKFRPLVLDEAARAARRELGDRFVHRFVSVRHPDNARFLAERLVP